MELPALRPGPASSQPKKESLEKTSRPLWPPPSLPTTLDAQLGYVQVQDEHMIRYFNFDIRAGQSTKKKIAEMIRQIDKTMLTM